MRRIIAVVLLTLIMATAGSVSAQSGQRIHIVAPGETLFGIALQYGVSLGQLADANGIYNVNWVYAGQMLIIPGGSYNSPIAAPFYPATPANATYTVRPGDTLAGIAAQYGSTPNAFMVTNGLSNPNRIVVGQALQIPNPLQTYGPSSYSYTVTYGDNLASIAARYGTTVAAIVSANSITNPNLIRRGTVLRIPV